MSYTLVQSNENKGAVGGGLSAPAALLSGATAGNKILLVAAVQTAGTLADSGFTEDAKSVLAGSGTNRAYLWSKDAVGGETSIPITGFAASADVCIWKVYEISGLTAGAVDKTAVNTGGVATAATRATGTTAATTQAAELAVAVVIGLNASAITFTGWSGGFTQQGSAASNSVSGAITTLGVAFLELAATGAQTSTATYSSSSAGCGLIGCYKESGGAPAATGSGFLPFF